MNVKAGSTCVFRACSAQELGLFACDPNKEEGQLVSGQAYAEMEALCRRPILAQHNSAAIVQPTTWNEFLPISTRPLHH
jgi:hypothetical protein